MAQSIAVLMGGEASPNESPARAGTRILRRATDPVQRGILRTVLDRPLDRGDGSGHRVTAEGREMLFVAFVAERWLQSAPAGPIDFESGEAQEAIGALAEGWSSTLVHALSRGPLGLEALGLATGTSRRGLRRQLETAQRVGLVETRAGDGDGVVYVATEWMRTAIAPLAAAARLERRDPKDDMVPIAARDVEAAFLLTLPLLDLPAELSGTCRLGVNLDDHESAALTGVTAEIEAGHVVACSFGLGGHADAWAAAPAGAWLDTVIEPDAKQVRTGGDRWLAAALLRSLHGKLFGVPLT